MSSQYNYIEKRNRMYQNVADSLYIYVKRPVFASELKSPTIYERSIRNTQSNYPIVRLACKKDRIKTCTSTVD